MNEEIKTVQKLPSALGREIGAQLARLTENAWNAVKSKFPNQAKPCRSCAFLAGTLPNGCQPTVMDAIKCVVEKKPFMCHQAFDADGNPTDVCTGWMIATAALADHPPIKTSYDFSD